MAQQKMAKKIEVWKQNGQPKNGIEYKSSEEKNYYDNFVELAALRNSVYGRLGWRPDNLFLPDKLKHLGRQQQPQQQQNPLKGKQQNGHPKNGKHLVNGVNGVNGHNSGKHINMHNSHRNKAPSRSSERTNGKSERPEHSFNSIGEDDYEDEDSSEPVDLSLPSVKDGLSTSGSD